MAFVMKFPDPRSAHPWPGAVQNLFAAWARRMPDKVALIDRDGTWTYGELDRAVAPPSHSGP